MPDYTRKFLGCPKAENRSIIIIAILMVILIGCKPKLKHLEEAWQSNDTCAVRAIIDDLAKIDNYPEFFGSIPKLANVTKLGYGYVDVEKNWDLVPQLEKETMRSNIISVFSLYCESKMFMDRNVPWDTTLQIQESYFPTDRKLNDVELKEIKQQFDKWHTQFN